MTGWKLLGFNQWTPASAWLPLRRVSQPPRNETAGAMGSVTPSNLSPTTSSLSLRPDGPIRGLPLLRASSGGSNLSYPDPPKIHPEIPSFPHKGRDPLQHILTTRHISLLAAHGARVEPMHLELRRRRDVSSHATRRRDPFGKAAGDGERRGRSRVGRGGGHEPVRACWTGIFIWGWGWGRFVRSRFVVWRDSAVKPPGGHPLASVRVSKYQSRKEERETGPLAVKELCLSLRVSKRLLKRPRKRGGTHDDGQRQGFLRQKDKVSYLSRSKRGILPAYLQRSAQTKRGHDPIYRPLRIRLGQRRGIQLPPRDDIPTVRLELHQVQLLLVELPSFPLPIRGRRVSG